MGLGSAGLIQLVSGNLITSAVEIIDPQDILVDQAFSFRTVVEIFLVKQVQRLLCCHMPLVFLSESSVRSAAAVPNVHMKRKS